MDLSIKVSKIIISHKVSMFEFGVSIFFSLNQLIPLQS